jgi:TetR/AcrR family fatty acid metabolism transcriptional regulator
LTAAGEVFSEYGFHETLVDEIATRAGLGKGTIYRYFKNKKELFKAVIVEQIEELNKAVLLESGKYDGTIEKIKAGIRAYLKYFGERKKLFLRLMLEHGEIERGHHDECCKNYLGQIELMRAFIEAGIKEGVFKDIDPKSLSYGIFGMINYVIFFKWIMSEEEYDIMDEYDTICEIILNGVQA